MTARAEQRIASLNNMMARKPVEHGKRVSYMQGCRCLPCRAANARHAAERALRRAQGKADPLVSSAGVRGHIRRLSALGIGRKQVGKASGVSNGIIWEISNGSRPNIRTSTERRILAVDAGARAGHALVDAAPTWAILDQLIRDGYSKRQLGEWLRGKRVNTLQLSRRFVRVETAKAVEQLAARIERGEMQRAR
jgi:hypothetical protein